MSPPRQSVRCSHTTAAGKPCRAWALRASDPPACFAHSGMAGAPPGNQNARTHGFYATVLDAGELADLLAYASDLSLDGEIACARIALRRVLDYLKAHTSPLAGDSVATTLPAADYTRLVSLSLQAVRTIARLVRDQQSSPASQVGLLPYELADLLDEEEKKHNRPS